MEPIKLIQARDKANHTQIVAAVASGVSLTTLSQFEAGSRGWDSMQYGTRSKIEAYVKKYGGK